MTPEASLALIGLAIGTLFTPGPNNAMLAASGANFGFRRTVPHMLGVATGFPVMMLIVGLLLGGLFQTSAVLRETLRWGGAAILLWLAWKIAFSGGIGSKRSGVHPLTYVQAAAFQWVNPKGWSMAIAAVSQFVIAAKPVASSVTVCGVFLGFGLLSSATWAFAGQSLTRWLTTDRRLRVFNVTMAALIVLSTVQLLAH
ncbi:LysE family translocator [Ostreiculturibacter nitratireducens]|uniref:LysE family translocator n=1 Tax=Ostreiculturibacter nitratireducens TaxID=3075226 RepID=UPI0031B649F6